MVVVKKCLLYSIMSTSPRDRATHIRRIFFAFNTFLWNILAENYYTNPQVLLNLIQLKTRLSITDMSTYPHE